MNHSRNSTNGLPVFFYGLFMDMEALRAKGLNPRNDQVVYIYDHSVHVRAKAILTSEVGKVAWGVLAQITNEEFDILYGHQSDYGKVPVCAMTHTGQPIAAVTMVHREPNFGAPIDPVYSGEWKAIVKRLHIPTFG